MELLLKVGGSQDPRYWRDGQIIDIRPDGFHNGGITRKHHCVLTLPGDYWQLRGSTNWKWPGQKVYDNIKKYLVAVDSQGKYPWERTARLDEKRLRRRDWFIDYKLLLDLGLITKSQFDAIYNKEKDPGLIYIERAFDQIIKNEYVGQRLPSDYTLSKGTIAEGTFSIGSGLNYDTVNAFEADIIDPGTGPLTGNLTGEHNNEETSTTAEVYFDVDTATYLFKLTAQSGDEHNGGAYGNGARINMGTWDIIQFKESIAGKFDNIEVSNLAFDISGSYNSGVQLRDGADTGVMTLNRLLLKGDVSSNWGIDHHGAARNINVRNCICYGFTNANYHGLGVSGDSSGDKYILNNTCIGNYNNIRELTAEVVGTLTVKNNLCQADAGGEDYSDAGGGFGTHAYNISEDDTSPDEAYQSKDVHTNSVFKDYANDDYRLDSDGDVTNLAIVDDGEDLSGTFTDDIEGQTRSTWYIGASEIVTAGGEISILPRIAYYNRLLRN